MSVFLARHGPSPSSSPCSMACKGLVMAASTPCTVATDSHTSRFGTCVSTYLRRHRYILSKETSGQLLNPPPPAATPGPRLETGEPLTLTAPLEQQAIPTSTKASPSTVVDLTIARFWNSASGATSGGQVWAPGDRLTTTLAKRPKRKARDSDDCYHKREAASSERRIAGSRM